MATTPTPIDLGDHAQPEAAGGRPGHRRRRIIWTGVAVAAMLGAGAPAALAASSTAPHSGTEVQAALAGSGNLDSPVHPSEPIVGPSAPAGGPVSPAPSAPADGPTSGPSAPAGGPVSPAPSAPAGGPVSVE